MPEPLLDLQSAASRLAITPRHLRELVYRRAIPFVKVGRLLRFRPDVLEAWLDENTVRAAH